MREILYIFIPRSIKAVPINNPLHISNINYFKKNHHVVECSRNGNTTTFIIIIFSFGYTTTI